MDKKYFTINIAEDFSSVLGLRYKEQGDFSGQAFYENHLFNAIKEAIDNNTIITIILDGVIGYPPSFLSESFGKASIYFGSDNVLKHIVFVSEESKQRLDRIIESIKNPQAR